jgi:transposase
MQRIPKRRYTAEFRAEAVKLVVEQRVGVAEAARRLDLPSESLAN